jgi:hypothetical protein
VDTALIALGGVFLAVGIVGCVLPIIPGPPIAYIALILVSWARDWEAFSPLFLIIMGVVTALVTAGDTVLPVLLPKRYGASKAGIWGSVVGMIAGMIFFPPFGLLLGAFLGAAAGELIFNPDKQVVLKAALGVFMGTVASIVLKLLVSGVILFYFVRAALRAA